MNFFLKHCKKTFFLFTDTIYSFFKIEIEKLFVEDIYLRGSGRPGRLIKPNLQIVGYCVPPFRLTQKLESHMFMFHLYLSFKNIWLVQTFYDSQTFPYFRTYTSDSCSITVLFLGADIRTADKGKPCAPYRIHFGIHR